jgi:NAD-dependent dihydropyrimidine dehydrogenase PreA subunit
VLSQRLGNTAIVPIRKNTDISRYNNYDRFGIITPVIDFGIPDFALKAIGRLKIRNPNAYVFSVVTHGGMPCAALSQIEKRLQKNQIKLSAGFLLRCGEKACMSENWIEQINQIADVVTQNHKLTVKIPIKDKLFTYLGNSAAKFIIPSQDKKFKVNDRCIGCGICQQVCPVENIKLINKLPVWLHLCEQCGACFSWCPQEAIYGANLAAKKRFRIPDVELSQMTHVQLPDGSRIDEV